MNELTLKSAAQQMNGNEYTEEGSRELFDQMKENRMVAVFGASDDLMEFHGAIEDEVGAYGGGSAYIDSNGLVENRCGEGDDCPNFKPSGELVEALWLQNDINASWTYKTDIPHETFDIMEDDKIYSRGIVFYLPNSDL